MAARLVISSVNHWRIGRAQAWLEARKPVEEVLIVSASLDAANELVCGVVRDKGAALGWHRLPLAQPAAAIARPALTLRGVVPPSRIGMHAVAARSSPPSQGARARPLRRSCRTPRFPRALAHVVADLRVARLRRDELIIAAPQLAPLMVGYEAELSGAGLTDRADVLEITAGAVGERRWTLLVGRPRLPLDMQCAATPSSTSFARSRPKRILAMAPAANESDPQCLMKRSGGGSWDRT
jgi:hypothetical protein